LTNAFNVFKEGVEAAIKRHCGGWGDYSFDELRSRLHEARKTLRGNKNKINPKWDATVAGLCRIALEEEEEARYARLWRPPSSS